MIEIIEPRVEVLQDYPTWQEKIEMCARVCYKTEVLMTGTKSMWRGFWDLRFKQSTGKVHPQMLQLTSMLSEQPGWMDYICN